MRLLHQIGVELMRRRETAVIVDIGTTGTRVLTGADILQDIDAWQRVLQQYGIRTGDRVVIALPNSPEFVTLFLALFGLGAVPVPFKLDYGRYELSAIARELHPCMVVVAEGGGQRVADYFSTATVITVGAAGNGLPSGSRTVTRHGNRPDPVSDLDPHYLHRAAEGMSINYTYRGLGYPLGAMVPSGQYLLGAEILARGMAEKPCSRMLTLLPMAHIFTLVACVFVPLLHDLTIYLAGTIHPRRLAAIVSEHRIDFLALVPEIASMLCMYAPQPGAYDSLDILATGGSALNPQQYDTIRSTLGVELLHGYGLTEFTPVSRNIRGSARAGTIGPSGNGVEVRISGSFPQPGDGGGEIQIRSSAMSYGYFRRLRETRDAFTPDGWFRTGDYGRLDADHLVFEREIKATCKINGAMVDREEVRLALLDCPLVAGAGVYCVDGVLHAEVRPAVFDVPPDDQLRSIRLFLRNYLAAYKTPKRITFITER